MDKHCELIAFEFNQKLQFLIRFCLVFRLLQHKRFVSECREKDPDVIFIGDCVLETLQHTQTWNQYFAPLHSLNFSIYLDETQNTLWRVQNGALDDVKPKASQQQIQNGKNQFHVGVHCFIADYRVTCWH